MSSTERAARAIKLLTDEEWKTLRGMERVAMSYARSDSAAIARLARIPVERVEFAVEKLNKKGLTEGRSGRPSLTLSAVEALALREYVKRDLVSALGAIIAKGKESDVYEAFTEEGRLLALKFFKLGRTSFRDVRRKRFIDRSSISSWMTLNYQAAKREFASLRRLAGVSDCIPKAISHQRSTILLEQIGGVKLAERPELIAPDDALRRILDCVRSAYVEAGLINGDLSEYNILTDGERVWLIDWPQSVHRSHVNGDELLRRDVRIILKFFDRVYQLRTDQEEAHSYVTGRSASLEVRRAEPSSAR